jgi:ribosomal protein S18 acetylase RimI-like enzyme
MKDLRKFIATTIKEYLNESIVFNHNENYGKFEIKIDDNIVSETNYSVNKPDEVFNQKYVALYALETNNKYRNMGYMTQLLKNIFTFVKTELGINYILLDVEKDNTPAINLYNSNGFEIYKNDKKDKYFTMLKKL